MRYKIYWLLKSQFFYCVFSWWNLVFGQIRYSIPEELQLGSFVGNITDDLGLDIKQLSARRFRIVPGPRKQYVDINLDTGILFVKEKIDREQICGTSLSCVISLDGLVENPLKLYQVAVEILDVNDNAPSFPKRQFRLEISEISTPGARYPLEGAHDPDIGTNSLQTYELIPNDYFLLDVQMRSGEGKLPVLVLQSSLDRETESSHMLTLIAKDGGVPVRSGTVQVTIIVKDANDNAPVFPQSIYRVSLLETAPTGTRVIILNATDLDDGPNGEITYSLSGHSSARVRELFDVDSKTGEIILKGNLDYEENKAFEINIQAIDNGPYAVSEHCDVLVEVIDVNDNAPEVTLTSFSSTVSEDVPVGTVVALFSAADKDSGPNGQVQCQTSNKLPFKLDYSMKNYYGLLVQHSLDRENDSKYDVTITCTDSGDPPLTSKQTIRMEVSDINDNAPRFTQSLYSASVMENNVIGASLFSIAAFDPDVGQNARLKYSILETQIQNASVSTYISINSETGVILAQRSFDYEKLKNFQFQAQATDSGTPPLTSKVSVNVIILDQNDNVPLIVNPLAEYGSTAVETISRFAEPGYLVTKVSATDADAGQNSRLSYSIFQATQHNLFTISPDSGEIWTIRRIATKDASKQRSSTDKNYIQNDSVRKESTGKVTSENYNNAVNNEVKQPNADWRFSQTHRAELNSSQYLEEEGVQRDIQREVQREVQCDVQREVPRDVQCDASRNIQREVQHDMQCDVQHVVEKDPGGPRKPMCARPAAIPAGRDGWTLPRTAPRMQLQMTLGTHVPGTLRSQYLLPRGVHTSGARISNSSVEFSAPLIGSLHGPWAANQTRDHRGISSSGGRRPELDTQACGEIPCSPPGQRLSTQCLHSRDHHHPLREVNY
ncbi:protocadherin-10-like isoform X16 [Carcharodon carcharias]|uniref:protocadherin-10-like isoform X16 n=1 Tax=Carcharodon carcharias TaxID=13397 RepID=UPI001B7E0E07|nr:protocadherin-10-like isoform X16 [Carcharodon carcharias]